MSVDEFKAIWFRDKAYEMDRASIDRINTKGDYKYSNCRFIEFNENMNRQKWTGWLKHKKCQKCKSNKEKHYCLGLCKKCYRKQYYIKKGK